MIDFSLALTPPDGVGEHDLVPLASLPRILPKNSKGQARDITTINRWCRTGLRGETLDFVWIGGERFTTMESLRRFVRMVGKKYRQDTSGADCSRDAG